jgi:hypothetical protein
MSDPKQEPTKAQLIYGIAYDEYKMLLESGVRYRRRDCRLVEQDTSTARWMPCFKPHLLHELYAHSNGMELRPSEVERELFPAIVAFFDQDPESHIHE